MLGGKRIGVDDCLVEIAPRHGSVWGVYVCVGTGRRIMSVKLRNKTRVSDE